MNSNPPDLQWDVREPFVHFHVVSAEDIDVLGHANNARYLVWLENSAWAHSASVGLSWERYQELGVAVVAKRTELDYLAEALEGDKLQVATWVAENQGRATMWRGYQIIRESDQKTLLRARTKWAVVDMKTGRPCKQPEEFKTGYCVMPGNESTGRSETS